MVVALLFLLITACLPELLIIIATNFNNLFKHNFHTHTAYCDGTSSPEDYVRAAMQAGLESIGFSGHAPVPFENHFAIPDINSLQAYTIEIQELKRKYKGKINVFLALETDYIPGITLDNKRFTENFELDYIIGSVHFVKNENGDLWFIDGPDRSVWQYGLTKYFNGNIHEAVSAYYRQINMMVETQRPEVIGHFDKITMHNHGDYFGEEEPWYSRLVKETLEIVKDNGGIVEVNTRGLYKKRSDSLFPGQKILEEMKTMDIPVTISSDAHKPEEVSLLFDEAAKTLIETGYLEIYIYNEGEWKSIPLA